MRRRTMTSALAPRALRITLLGGFDARLASGKPLPLRTRKSRALLACLALSAGRPQSRDALATLLWSGFADEQARANLRHTVFEIRRALGRAADVLHTVGEDVA